MGEKYIISEESRHYLDAILDTFIYNRINNICGQIEKIVISEKRNISKREILMIALKIQSFLEINGFGHSADYVFIIDEKGIELKNAGSLGNYEGLHQH